MTLKQGESEMVGATVRDHIHRYFVAVYGKDYVFKAPEAFNGTMERWLAYIAMGSREMAEQTIQDFEEAVARQKQSQS